MNMLWEGVKATGRVVGQAAVETGMKGKLQTDLLLIKREIEYRKRAFGEELYAYVVCICMQVPYTRALSPDKTQPFLSVSLGAALEECQLFCC